LKIKPKNTFKWDLQLITFDPKNRPRGLKVNYGKESIPAGAFLKKKQGS